MNKVIGGTPISGSSMCHTCRKAFHMKTVNLGEIVICRAVGHGMKVSAPIVECGDYDDKRQPSLYDMEQIAWEVKTRNRGVTGFAPDKSLLIEITPPERKYDQPAGSPVQV